MADPALLPPTRVTTTTLIDDNTSKQTETANTSIRQQVPRKSPKKQKNLAKHKFKKRKKKDYKIILTKNQTKPTQKLTFYPLSTVQPSLTRVVGLDFRER